MRLFPIVLLILASVFDAAGQKEAIPGVWRGKVESVDANTNQITLSPMSGKTAETFTGVLAEDAKVRLLDDSIKDLSISDIPPGMYVRAFYDTKNARIGGQQVKVNRIKGILFLGRDGFDKLRVAMSLPPSTVFRLSLSDAIPSTNPLKLYIFVQPPRSQADLVKWVGKWNKEAANTYGSIELVPGLEQTDLCVLVQHREVEWLGLFEENDLAIVPSASALLAVPKDGALEVLWKIEPLVSSTKSSRLMDVIAKQIEKRMKARGKP